MKKLYIVFLFSLLGLNLNAQVFVDQVTNHSGVIYYNGNSYSGVVIDMYSNKQHRLEANYLNGKLNGKYTEWFDNGKVKISVNYSAGKQDGKYVKYYENGNKNCECNFKLGGIWTSDTTVWYEDGKKKFEGKYYEGLKDGDFIIYNESGKITKMSTYNKDKLLKLNNYKDGQPDGIWVEWYDNGKKKSEISYQEGKKTSEANYTNDGLGWKQIRFLEDGKTQEITYENGEKTSEGFLISGKPEGEWIYWYDNGKKVTEKTFKNGVLINEKTKMVANLVSRFIPTSSSYLFRTRENDKVFFRFDFNAQKVDEYYDRVKDAIVNNLISSDRLTLKHDFYGADKDESINYFVECTNIIVNFTTWNCAEQGKTYTCYNADIKVTYTLKNTENQLVDTKTYYATSYYGFLSSGHHYSSQDAFNFANKTNYVKNFIDECFPIKTFITKIQNQSKKGLVETVVIDGGNNIGIYSSNKFNVYEENTNIAIGIIQAKKVSNESTICKVIDGEAVITSKLNQKIKLRVVATK